VVERVIKATGNHNNNPNAQATTPSHNNYPNTHPNNQAPKTSSAKTRNQVTRAAEAEEAIKRAKEKSPARS